MNIGLRVCETGPRNERNEHIGIGIDTYFSPHDSERQWTQPCWKMSAATALFLFLAATVHPWYLAWLAVLLPLYPRWSFLVFTATVAVANWSGVHYAIIGDWIEPLWIGLATYLPVIVVLILEWIGVVPVPDTPTSVSAG